MDLESNSFGHLVVGSSVRSVRRAFHSSQRSLTDGELGGAGAGLDAEGCLDRINYEFNGESDVLT